jgi:small subunit ribosomal protein S6
MSTVRQYELIYITPPETTEEALAGLHQLVAETVGRFGAAIERTENWGRRRLAYEIGGHREGVYVLDVINGPAALVTELERRLRVSDLVIRHLVVRVDEDLAAADRAATRRKQASMTRRTRRGLPPEPVEGERRRGDDDADDNDDDDDRDDRRGRPSLRGER